MFSKLGILSMMRLHTMYAPSMALLQEGQPYQLSRILLVAIALLDAGVQSTWSE